MLHEAYFDYIHKYYCKEINFNNTDKEKTSLCLRITCISFIITHYCWLHSGPIFRLLDKKGLLIILNASYQESPTYRVELHLHALKKH